MISLLITLSIYIGWAGALGGMLGELSSLYVQWVITLFTLILSLSNHHK